jgi:hypothetical protein
LPRFSHPSVPLALKPRGFALPVAPPNEAASCPASCIFRLCRRRTLELPRVSRPSAHPVVKLRSPRSSILRLRLLMLPPGRPGFCIFRPCRRWIFESPRISHPSAHLPRQLRVSPQSRLSSCACRCISRVAPVSASSGFAGDGLSSCLASRVLRRIWRWCFGLPLGSAFPVAPPGMVAGCPALPHLPALPWVQVSGLPRILSPSAPVDGSPSCLGSRTLRLCRPCVFRSP